MDVGVLVKRQGGDDKLLAGAPGGPGRADQVEQTRWTRCPDTHATPPLRCLHARTLRPAWAWPRHWEWSDPDWAPCCDIVVATVSVVYGDTGERLDLPAAEFDELFVLEGNIPDAKPAFRELVQAMAGYEEILARAEKEEGNAAVAAKPPGHTLTATPCLLSS